MKVTGIEEAQDISSVKVDELIGSLQNFEITINSKTDKKGKGIAFVSNVDLMKHKEIMKMMKICQSLLCYLGDSSKRFLNKLTEDPYLMVRTSGPTLTINQIKRRWQELMRRILNTRVFNVMNVKGMATSEQNVLLFLKDIIKAWLFHGQMEMTQKMKCKMNLPNMSLH